MKYQLMEAIDIFGEEVSKALTPPAGKHLLEINKNTILLEKSRSEVFHSVTAKLLYITKIERTDL